jgi:putative membrane protein
MGFGWLFWVIVIFLVIWAINNANRRRWYHQGPFLPQETAMDILKKRYAKGEISKEDFDRMKKDLES